MNMFNVFKYTAATSFYMISHKHSGNKLTIINDTNKKAFWNQYMR